MTDSQFSIMIVDDAEENRFLLESLLEDDFHLSFASAGQECLDLVPQEKIDLILLDVSMPDMSGHEVCRQLKKSKTSVGIPVIFVSGLVSPEERLAGFEAGGDEYVTKPVDYGDLFNKINASLETREANLKLQSTADDAVSIAMEAMHSSSELGILNQFMRDSAQAQSYEILGDYLLEVTRHFGLNCCIQFRDDERIINIACEDDSLEAKLLIKFKGGDKLIDFGARTILNSEQAALLIKNMPVEDEAKYGRLKDHLAVLIDTVAVKVINLNLAGNLTKQRDNMITELLSNNEAQLVTIRNKISERDVFTLKIMREVISDVESQLFSLGLEEDQEKRLMEMLDSGLARVENLPGFTEEIESSFEEATKALRKLLSKQAKH